MAPAAGVGVAAIQLAVAAGIKIIGSAGSNEGLKLIKTEGAQHTVNHSSSDYQKQVLDLTNGRGVDVIVEMLANVNLGHDLKMLAPRGRVVVVGSRGSVEINPRDLMTREGAVFGMVIWDVPDSEAAEIHAALQARLGNGTLRPVIASELPLASTPETHRRIMESGARGKIVLVP
jgi:NADPH2:quinone reductase